MPVIRRSYADEFLWRAVLLSDRKSSNMLAFCSRWSQKGVIDENNNTLAGGIKAVPVAGHGYYRPCAFIPKACGGNGVTSVESCTAADRRRQLLQKILSSMRKISSGRLFPSCPACSSAALHNVIIRPSDSEVRSELIMPHYVKAG
jgi:hypothetical protein